MATLNTFHFWVTPFLCNEGRRKELMLFKTSLKFSLPMHVLYKLNLSSFLSFIFSSYLFSNWSQTIGAFISSLFSLQCNEIFKWLSDLQVIGNSVWQVISDQDHGWAWSGSSIHQGHNHICLSWCEFPLIYTIWKQQCRKIILLHCPTQCESLHQQHQLSTFFLGSI